MLSTIQIERYADVLLWALFKARGKRYAKNEIVLVRYALPAIPLAEVLQRKILEKGLHAVLRTTGTAGMEKTFFEKANARQLLFQPPGEKELYESLHGAIYIHGPESLTHLAGIDPGRIGKAAVARKPLRDILNHREDNGLFGWTLCAFPTEEQARHAGLTLEVYAQQIVKACFLNRKEPVAAWEDVYKEALRIKKWLNAMDVEAYRIVSQGMDLLVKRGESRQWVGVTGHNIPSFELFLSPDWRGTEGVYYANQPSFRNGNFVSGVRLVFRRGSVVEAEAEDGEAFLKGQLASDRGASRIGEFSLTDRRFSKIDRFMANTLYDENFGGRRGNCHVALGSSYSDSYAGDPAELHKEKKEELGFNDSAVHWDLVNTEDKQVTALLKDGKEVTIYRDGKFTRK